ncbi:large conductance mechanosensitive channel [Metabacillus crassostreae]|uniref:large-conductance mechanosensitive channel protein MscL n=1 Tax=Metabacillus crassostreae TaxID=929098 RepID=UPI0019578332|nr:large-conductance mechanosensitive channel protein MscL [Metabacillus crassostreae]MBM7603537.1 large conductance mechanosensitive channel [Metabacillus crassostreae]
MFKQFLRFAVRGNVIDLAVGVIIGTAFGKIVTSLVDDLVMPIIGIALGGINLKEFSFTFKDSSIQYGSFLQTVLDFIIITYSIFFFVQLFYKLRKIDHDKPIGQTKTNSELLLEEIRDLLKEKRK